VLSTYGEVHMSSIETAPRLGDTGTGAPKVAHIVKKGDATRGYIEGAEIEAICGERFIPSRDPERLPVCEACKATLERIRATPGN
jgi:hypothetical protein